jgi:hypothetical protein
MEIYTASIAAAFCILALIVRPGFALGLLVASSLIWPEYLRISLGAEMSIPRLVTLVLLVKLVALGRPQKAGFKLPDLFVIGVWFWGITASLLGDGEPSVTRMIGAGLDTMLVYFAARWSLLTEHDVAKLRTPLFLVAGIMCTFALVEAASSYSPYHQLEQYRAWENIGQAAGERLGFLRARASTSVPIFFGLAMMVLASLLWTTRGYHKNRIISYFGVFFSGLGALASLSSGPWIGCILLFALNFLRKRTHWIKPILWLLLALVVFIELASNRHFYHLISYLGLSGGTSYYRVRLIEVMMSHMDEYWLFGIGEKSTDHWIREIGGQGHLDIVNHFLLIAYLSGIMYTILYVAAHVAAITKAIKTYRNSITPRHRELIFCAIAGLVALDITSLSVGIYGPALIISHIMLGAVTTFAHYRTPPQKPRTVKVSDSERAEA